MARGFLDVGSPVVEPLRVTEGYSVLPDVDLPDSDWFSNYYSNLGIKSNSDSLIKEFQNIAKGQKPSDLQNIVDKTKKAEEFFEERNEREVKELLQESEQLTEEATDKLLDFLNASGGSENVASYIDGMLKQNQGVVSVEEVSADFDPTSSIQDVTAVSITQPGFLPSGNVGMVSVYDVGSDAALTEVQEAITGAQSKSIESASLKSGQTANMASKLATSAAAIYSLDQFFEDPNFGTGLMAASSTAAAAATFGSTTGAALSSVLGPTALMYAGVNLIRALSYDKDYARDSTQVMYKDGEFVLGASRAYDRGMIKSSKGQALATTEMLNTLVKDYGFVVDEEKANELLEDRAGNSFNTMMSNPTYVRGVKKWKNTSMTGSEMLHKFVKNGVISVGEDTPDEIVNNQAAFVEFMAERFKETQNIYATYAYDNYGGDDAGDYVVFTSFDSALNYGSKLKDARDISTVFSNDGQLVGYKVVPTNKMLNEEFYKTSFNPFQPGGGMIELYEPNPVFTTVEQANSINESIYGGEAEISQINKGSNTYYKLKVNNKIKI